MKSPLFLLPLAALSLSACGYSVFDAAEDISESNDNGLVGGTSVTTTPATTPAFTELQALGPDNIVFVTGDSFQISAAGDAAAMKNLLYKVKDGKIIIGRKGDKFWSKGDKGVTITVTAPRLSDVSLAGSGSFTADNMTGDNVTLESAGSGSMSVATITAKSLETNLAGSGDVVLGGKVERAEYSIAGSGNIDAVKMASTDAEVSIAGSGNVKLTATGKVDASVAGSGSIDVTGGAKCTSSTMGSGEISCS
jgi:Putative auto-transporter adhesin, head GIN domain